MLLWGMDTESLFLCCATLRIHIDTGGESAVTIKAAGHESSTFVDDFADAVEGVTRRRARSLARRSSAYQFTDGLLIA